jgi:hypothetical protein
MREKFVLNGDGIVWVRFVDSEEEGEKKAGGVKALNALRKRAKKSSASPPVVCLPPRSAFFLQSLITSNPNSLLTLSSPARVSIASIV